MQTAVQAHTATATCEYHQVQFNHVTQSCSQTSVTDSRVMQTVVQAHTATATCEGVCLCVTSWKGGLPTASADQGMAWCTGLAAGRLDMHSPLRYAQHSTAQHSTAQHRYAQICTAQRHAECCITLCCDRMLVLFLVRLHSATAAAPAPAPAMCECVTSHFMQQ
jgi:hypothetical protein